MKVTISLILLLGFGSFAWAQQPSATPSSAPTKQELKAQKKAQKEAEKAAKKQAKAEAAERELKAARATVSVRDINSLPSTFVGQTLRLAHVGLKEIKEFQDGQSLAYLMGVEDRDDSTMAFPLNGRLTLVLQSELAMQVFSEIRDVPAGYRKIANVWFDLMTVPDSRGNYYLGKVHCVEILNWNGGVNRVLGKCPAL